MTAYLPGDVLLVAGHSWQDRCIQLAQLRRDGAASKWTHAALLTSTNGDIVEAAGTHGVRRGHVSAYVKLETVVLPIAATDAQRQAAVAFAEKQVGRLYDWADLPSVGLNLLVNDPITMHSSTRWICSFLVAAALVAAGYVWPRDPADISPGDLAVLLTASAAHPKSHPSR